MLVLSRKVGEKIVIPGLEAEITVVAVKGRAVRLGILAPAEVAVRREEVIRREAAAEHVAGQDLPPGSPAG
jgi:carbon storage regulator